MASSSQKKTTMAKLNREAAVRERKQRKQAKKEARKQASLDDRDQASDVLDEDQTVNEPAEDGGRVAEPEGVAGGP
jgi:hypothetical protein